MKCCEVVICPFARQARFEVCFLMWWTKCELTRPLVGACEISVTPDLGLGYLNPPFKKIFFTTI